MKYHFFLLFCLTFSLCFAQNNYQKEDLLLHLPMNGDAKDHSKYNLETFPQNVFSESDILNNKNGSFNFSDNGSVYIKNVENFKNMLSFSLCSWIFLTRYDSHSNIISLVDPGRDFNLQIIETGQINFHFSGNDGYYHWYTKEKLALNKWYFVAVVFNKSDVKIYIDGKNKILNPALPLNTNIKVPFYKKIKWQANNLTIGNLYPNANENFNGLLDDVCIYEKALSPLEIANLQKSKMQEKNKTYEFFLKENSSIDWKTSATHEELPVPKQEQVIEK